MQSRGNRHRGLSRRRFLAGSGAGLAGLALPTWAVPRADVQGEGTGFRVPAKAKRCIYLVMNGGPSQMDLFDPKPELSRRDGQTITIERRHADMAESTLLGSKRSFARYGETGQWCSDALPNVARHMDKLAVVRSMETDSFAHGSALLQLNSGQLQQGHPALGAWISYGLGRANPDLPAFVVMHDPRGGPFSGPANWSSGYIPAEHQGTLFRSAGSPLLDLDVLPEKSVRGLLTRDMQRDQLDAMAQLNALHGQDAEMSARGATYELAYRMQEAAPEALDLSSEDERTRELYGLHLPRGEHMLSIGPAPFGRQCLIARRLIERGVRFVQIYHGGGHQQSTWDGHHGIEENLAIHCPEVDVPIAGLLTDLERRGLLDETLVVWGGEFGRTSTTQTASEFQVAANGGRDHNPRAFCMWLAGAGVRPGPYGETDELGLAAQVDKHHLRDMHATILHLMGLDHERLTYRYGGLDRKLTGVIQAHPIRGVMA